MNPWIKLNKEGEDDHELRWLLRGEAFTPSPALSVHGVVQYPTGTACSQNGDMTFACTNYYMYTHASRTRLKMAYCVKQCTVHPPPW